MTEARRGVGEAGRRPFGSWPSPLAIELLVEGSLRLSEPSLDGQDVYWLEGRPADQGRQVLVRRSPDGSLADVSPEGVNVRDRVHEYGGGAYVVDAGSAWFSSFADGRLYRRDPDDAVRPVTPEGPFRYADPIVDRRRGRLICVREDHSRAGEAVNALVSVPLDGNGPVRVLVGGSDFYSDPRLSPDGTRLAWLSWDHPNLPWDETSLWVGTFAADGSIGSRERIAGELGESVLQPRWSPSGVLHFVAERTGWWNVWRRLGGRDEIVLPMAAEFADPQWVFGRSNYGLLDDGRILACGRRDGRDALFLADPASGRCESLDVPFTEVGSLHVGRGCAVFTAGSPTRSPALVRLDLAGDRGPEVLRESGPVAADPADISVGQHVEFPTADGLIAHGIFYAPHNRAWRGVEGELPPLIVTSHGGPTAGASSALDLETQLFTSRGLAVLDVDYGGSTGYGRDYRKRLEGTWGITDVEDCMRGALAMAERGLVDRGRIAMRGGSASGYTTLCALTFHDELRAGVSYFGIGDLETFARTTHKFESRYLDSLVGPYPERRDLYVARSPLNFTDRITAPTLILQGLDDRIVPPSQAEQIVAGLRANHVPHAYLAFEGEDHGFRRAASIIRSFEAELSFFGQVFGFEPADDIVPIVIERP